MSLDLEDYIEKVTAELRQASDLKVWEVPMHHRTKDSVSSYRAAVGMVAAVMLKVLRELKTGPQVSGEPAAQPQQAQPVQEQTDGLSVETEATPSSIFDDEQPRQRRRRETNNAA